MKRAIIIGDATHNTLSAVRSLGEERIPLILLMVAERDPLFVRKSRYLKKQNLYIVKSLDECDGILNKLKDDGKGQTLITTFDVAAEWVDEREPELSGYFRTPCRGRQIGKLFHKDEQCKLADECGLTVPKSVVYHRGDALPTGIEYPILTKPLVSSCGEKSDIHICYDENELNKALQDESHCGDLVIQEYIDKEFEINCTGVRTDDECILAGAIRKIRHWPRITGASTFAYFDKIEKFDVDLKGVGQFLEKVGYYGPFSVEFIHKDDKNYFLEVNLRNDGLAYTATAAGLNLHALYLNEGINLDWSQFHPVYMMNTSIDPLYVKEGDITWKQWFSDFRKTTAFINFNKKDLMPMIWYYLNKLKNR